MTSYDFSVRFTTGNDVRDDIIAVINPTPKTYDVTASNTAALYYVIVVCKI